MESWNGGHLESSGKPFTYLNLELGLKELAHRAAWAAH